MSRRKPAAELPPELPQSGGRYIRQEDGSLVQVEGPGVEPAPPAGAPAETTTEEEG